MKVKEMTIKERRQKLLADPKFQALIKAKVDAIEEFLVTGDLSAIKQRKG